MNNPIQYTSRSFQTILADINSDVELADKPEWWKRIWAGVGDVISVWLDAAANNAYLRTAFSRRAVADLCQLIDYEMGAATTSQGIILFDLKDGVSLPANVARINLSAQIPGTVEISEKRFEALDDATVQAKTLETVYTDWDISTDVVTVPSRLYTGEKIRFTTNGTIPGGIVVGNDYFSIEVSETEIKVATTRAGAFAGDAVDITSAGSGNHYINCRSRPYLCRQQTSVDTKIAGVSDGNTAWQEYQLQDADIIKDSISVEINEENWTRVDTFAFSDNLDKHFRVSYLSDNTAVIEFGNGEYGKIPGAGAISVSYSVGGGVLSNVVSGNRILQYSGASGIFESTTNPGPVTGGADPQGMLDAKRLAPLLLKARDRFVTVEDGESLAEGYGGLSQARVIPNAFGVLTARVVGVANGGGNPGPSLQGEIEAYLEERSVLGSIDVTFNNLTITPVAVTSAAQPMAGQFWSVVGPMFELGWKLVLTESGKEIYVAWRDDGILSAIETINTIFSSAYDPSDSAWISQLIQQYERFPPRAIGDSLHESEATAFIKNGIPYIQYMTIAAPAFPLVQAEDEILTNGVLTLTEIP